MEKQSIKNWAIDDRPREKLAAKGAHTLSNSELLAILINNGTPQRSALDLAKDLLASVDHDIKKLGRLSVNEILNSKIKGLGPAKAITIAAALELGIRREMADAKKDSVANSRELAQYLKAQFQYKKHEVFAVVYLGRSNKVIQLEIISEGGITGTIADPRIIVKKALEHNAVQLVLCHNHPSGSLKPSRHDEELTLKIKMAAKLFDINVLDHIIVSDEGFYSFADEGIL